MSPKHDASQGKWNIIPLKVESVWKERKKPPKIPYYIPTLGVAIYKES
jgi:hypothetical protein